MKRLIIIALMGLAGCTPSAAIIGNLLHQPAGMLLEVVTDNISSTKKPHWNIEDVSNTSIYKSAMRTTGGYAKWGTSNPSLKKFIAEAKRRGFTEDKCSSLIGRKPTN
jgi:hypothetical protein